MKDYCCILFRRSVENGDIKITKKNNKEIFLIYGVPTFVDDGGYLDDMTDELEIVYCPFCGTKLEIK